MEESGQQNEQFELQPPTQRHLESSRSMCLVEEQSDAALMQNEVDQQPDVALM